MLFLLKGTKRKLQMKEVLRRGVGRERERERNRYADTELMGSEGTSLGLSEGQNVGP